MRSTGGRPVSDVLVARCASEHGTMVSVRSTVNTTGSSTSVRTLATCLPAATTTGTSRAAESQNVTSARAAAGGNRRTPISSRNRR